MVDEFNLLDNLRNRKNSMVSTPNSLEQLGAALHYNPGAYWCPQCWTFTEPKVSVRATILARTRLITDSENAGFESRD